jgi:hypothetical protein
MASNVWQKLREVICEELDPSLAANIFGCRRGISIDERCDNRSDAARSRDYDCVADEGSRLNVKRIGRPWENSRNRIAGDGGPAAIDPPTIQACTYCLVRAGFVQGKTVRPRHNLFLVTGPP